MHIHISTLSPCCGTHQHLVTDLLHCCIRREVVSNIDHGCCNSGYPLTGHFAVLFIYSMYRLEVSVKHMLF